MNIDSVISQLRAYCAPLGTRVGGAADFQTGTENIIAFTDPTTGILTYPAAVVVPLEDDAEPNDTMDGDQQLVSEKIAIIVEFDATADRRGQSGVDQVEAMKYALHGALLNWRIDPERSARGLYYSGGQLLSFDRARLFWQFVYGLDITITDADGFQLRGDPLTNVTATFNIDNCGTAEAPAFSVQILPEPTQS